MSIGQNDSLMECGHPREFLFCYDAPEPGEVCMWCKAETLEAENKRLQAQLDRERKRAIGYEWCEACDAELRPGQGHRTHDGCYMCDEHWAEMVADAGRSE